MEAAYLSRPELVDYNSAGAVICEKTQLKIKFDHENFNSGNVFTVEIALNGSFTGGNIISMTGSLSQSGNQQNVFLTVGFPANVPAGSNFRLRVRGSNPVSFSSQLNEYPFSVAKLPPSDPSLFPESYWRGYFYTWTPSIATPITDGSTEDIFNPARYIGYICENDLSFEYNWGPNTAAPGSFADSNKVCGANRDFYSIQMKRRYLFDEGYYKFSGGADDGFRFSIDGGQTWLLNDWSDHQFREINNTGSNACGIFLTAGYRDLVVEFYENKIDARFKFSMEKSPSAADFVGLSPSYCINSPASTLFSLSPSLSGTFIGPGINANIFSPQQAGTGEHTIMYFILGSSGTCSDTVRKLVNVYNLPDAGFNGLPGSVCEGGQPLKLNPNTTGGTLSGPGLINENEFSTAGLAAGSTANISYSITENSCSNQSSQTVVIQAIPDAGFSGLPDSAGSDGGQLNLIPNLAGGVFSGPGTEGASFYCDRVEAPGEYEITYSITTGGCSNSSTKRISIYPVFFGIPNLLTINGDGLNEDWILSGIPQGSRIQIFNRWGKQVADNTLGEGPAWKPDNSLHPGTYFFIIEQADARKRWAGHLSIKGNN
jgi:gliding motility-associated-like protein